MRRTALALVAAGWLAAQPLAHASPQQHCPIITDAAGDVDVLGDPTLDPSGDLLKVDVAGVGRSTRLTVTLAALDPSMPVWGHAYEVFLSDGERTFYAMAVVDSGRGDYTVWQMDVGSGAGPGASGAAHLVGEATGHLYVDRRQVVMVLDDALLPFSPHRRLRIDATALRSTSTANTLPHGGGVSRGDPVDFAGPGTYRLGTGGCG